jgi:uncharacterized protein YjgD (DUF1641 family)
MNENQNPWETVAEQFQAFGKSLSEAVQTSWNDPKTKNVIEQIKNGLDDAAREIDQAIETTRQDPKVQNFVDEAKETFEQLGETGKEALDQAKPHVLKAMESLSSALNKAINDYKDGHQPE